MVWTAAALAMILASTPAAEAASGHPAQRCATGPVTKTYGGSPWLVYSCSDGKTLVFVSPPGSPSSPFYFELGPTDGGYHLYGEGTGNKTATDAAAHDLSALAPDRIAGLIAETRAISDTASAPPAQPNR
jgi:hypothetical protein